MRTPGVALAAALVLLLSGCLLAPENAIRPTGPRNPWTTTDAQPWIAVTDGCGFCSGNPTVPEIETVAVYEDGGVLWMRYGSASSGEGVNFTPQAAPYAKAVRTLVPRLDNGWVAHHALTIHEVATARLSPAQWDAIHERLAVATASARDPGPPNYGCVDCAGRAADLLGTPEFHVMLLKRETRHPEFGNYNDGGAWASILAQVDTLKEWVRPSPTASR